MKTIIKQFIPLIVILFCSIDLSAQGLPDSVLKKEMCDGYMSTPYLFEGKLDSAKYFTVQTGEHTYANYMGYLVEVDKVIKGNIQKGTIELVYYADGVTYRGSDHISSMKSSERSPGAPSQGIYLGFDTTGYRMASHYKNSNHKTLFFHGGISVTKEGKLVKNPMGTITADRYFPTLADFYAYIKENYGIDVSTK